MDVLQEESSYRVYMKKEMEFNHVNIMIWKELN